MTSRRLASLPYRVALVAATVLVLASCTPATPPQPTASPTPVRDSGFDVATDGFRFQNYGNEEGFENLDADAMQALFGDQVCARIDDRGCALYPSAKAWMRTANDSMDGGHCFGMAGLSWAMYKKAVDPEAFGGADAAELRIAGNTALQRELAEVFATQYTKPTSASKVDATPVQAIAELERAWADGKGYILGIFRVEDGEQTDGHAVTPIAVDDLGGGRSAIVVYDNNFPDEPKRITVDTADNTWQYTTTSDPRDDPERYEGGAANRIEMFPVDPMLGPQQCPFCAGSDEEPPPQDETLGSEAVPLPPEFNMVFLNQEAGHRGVTVSLTGDDRRPVPGQSSLIPLSDSGSLDPPVEFVPKEEPFVVDVDATGLRKPADTDVTIIGPGYAFAVTDIDMVPGQRDVIRFEPSANRLRYRTEVGAAPDIVLGLDHPEASYEFLFGGLELSKGGEIDIRLDPAQQTVTASAGDSGDSTIDFQLDRITDSDDERFTSEPIPLAAGESIVVQYGRWRGDGEPMPVGIDQNGDGVIDEKLIPPDAR